MAQLGFFSSLLKILETLDHANYRILLYFTYYLRQEREKNHLSIKTWLGISFGRNQTRDASTANKSAIYHTIASPAVVFKMEVA